MVFSSNTPSNPVDPWPYWQNQWIPSPAAQKDVLDEFKKAYRLILEEKLMRRLDIIFEEEFKDIDQELIAKIKNFVDGEVYGVLRDDPLWP